MSSPVGVGCTDPKEALRWIAEADAPWTFGAMNLPCRKCGKRHKLRKLPRKQQTWGTKECPNYYPMKPEEFAREVLKDV